MAVNLVAKAVGKTVGGNKKIIFDVYFTSTYTNSPAGDLIDFTATLNPDGTQRNPGGLVGASPSSLPTSWSENGGDMGGNYIGLIVKGKTLATCASRFYAASGAEVGTGAAYSAGTPVTLATTQLQITIEGPAGKF